MEKKRPMIDAIIIPLFGLKKKRHDEGRIVLLNASMNSKTITKMEVSFGIYA